MNVEFNSDSALGTKEYWDQHYDVELTNFDDTGDEGCVWFGRSSENRMLKFIRENVPSDASIVDLGCGNGSFLRRLRSQGYTKLCGLDYSEKAIELCRKTSNQQLEGKEAPEIDFQTADILSDLNETQSQLCHRYDVVLDKGTWDAISLNGDRMLRLAQYRSAVLSLFRGSGEKRYFVIFSCNFTRDELVELFKCEALNFFQEIPSQSQMTFGGKTGVTTTGVVFRVS
ncbi:methyltransferase domain-containing protein [Ditylenchus destructor]|uniref:Protein-lysine N-methyltransferase DdX_13866 n=1 Tax=Ditylenchus destructor TaxID=166010 RepID=A0AAD4MVF9_9BILA|nr:methyltransferase domain-containing protein [Ditylenchus destructor]